MRIVLSSRAPSTSRSTVFHVRETALYLLRDSRFNRGFP
jgi:hypothetical protein